MPDFYGLELVGIDSRQAAKEIISLLENLKYEVHLLNFNPRLLLNFDTLRKYL